MQRKLGKFRNTWKQPCRFHNRCAVFPWTCGYGMGRNFFESTYCFFVSHLCKSVHAWIFRPHSLTVNPRNLLSISVPFQTNSRCLLRNATLPVAWRISMELIFNDVVDYKGLNFVEFFFALERYRGFCGLLEHHVHVIYIYIYTYNNNLIFFIHVTRAVFHVPRTKNNIRGICTHTLHTSWFFFFYWENGRGCKNVAFFFIVFWWSGRRWGVNRTVQHSYSILIFFPWNIIRIIRHSVTSTTVLFSTAFFQPTKCIRMVYT